MNHSNNSGMNHYIDDSMNITKPIMMVEIPETLSYDYWFTKRASDFVELTCLLPNGVVVPLETNRNSTLAEIKDELWDEAIKYPLQVQLNNSESYLFSCINSTNAEAIELRDESRRLCDVKPFCSVLKVIKQLSKKTEEHLDSDISLLIGKGLHEFDSLQNTEVNDFRKKSRVLGEEIALARMNYSWEEKVRYQYPSRLSTSDDIPKTVLDKIKDGNIVLVTKFEHTEVR
ncbi:hypothetical protein HCN44_001518 [Aphidius gifuensis]|uniref:PI3K-ABD domain-containing protein n=1 Tax=Aphidius gifuensis TaxID=684658 RepID=A0A835CSE7_APHGI|nr:hypothetical protein HCN44_001518 [Aphidius gifuensis]